MGEEAKKKVITVQEVENGFMIVDLTLEARPVRIANNMEEVMDSVSQIFGFGVNPSEEVKADEVSDACADCTANEA